MKINRIPIPKPERNDFICRICNEITKHRDLKLNFTKNSFSSCSWSLEIENKKLHTNNFDLWDYLFPNDKTNFLDISYKRSSLEILVKICSKCGNRIIWDYDTNDKDYKIANSKYDNFEISEPNEYMPKNLKNIYNEAKSISRLSPRASSAFLRYLLEQMINNKFPSLKEKSLNEKLNDEKLKVTIGENLISVVNSLRIIGNKSIHTLEIDLDELTENIDKFFDWINDVSNNLFKNYERISNDAKNIENAIVKSSNK